MDTAVRIWKEEGKKEGRAEGKKEKQIEIAKNLLDVLDIETISKKTGLSIKEIKELF
jgi:predicted transposase/invertase (TIGR01784 family)